MHPSASRGPTLKSTPFLYHEANKLFGGSPGPVCLKQNNTHVQTSTRGAGAVLSSEAERPSGMYEGRGQVSNIAGNPSHLYCLTLRSPLLSSHTGGTLVGHCRTGPRVVSVCPCGRGGSVSTCRRPNGDGTHPEAPGFSLPSAM